VTKWIGPLKPTNLSSSFTDPENSENIDWLEQAKRLKEKGVRVYSVQALGRTWATQFYKQLAQETMGFHLKLHQFSYITDFLTAVCYNEADQGNLEDDESTGGGRRLDAFEAQVASSGRMVNNLPQLFTRLRNPDAAEDETDSGRGGGNLVPISPSRFQVLTVDVDQAIKVFAERRGFVFKAGRGFYQFTKPESISDKKEIVLMEKGTGDFYTGCGAARDLAGISPGKKDKQMPKESEKYVVFVQSSSYNRKLLAGHQFLYEVDPDG
jgi:hypothetical protein